MSLLSHFSRSTAAYVLALALAATPGLSGCAAMLSIGNPSAAVKVAEGAHLGVVVRRAEAAMETATQIDRLLASPIGGKAKWPEKLLINQADAQKLLLSASKSGLYANQPADVMPVEVWAHLLPRLEAEQGDHPSLLAKVAPELADHHRKILEKYERYVSLREAAARAQDAFDEEKDGLDEKAKAVRKAALDKNEADVDAAEAAFDTAKTAFVDLARTTAAKTSPTVRDQIGPVVARLREAVSDADTANGAALVRYPLAVPSLMGDAQHQAGIFLADVIEEKSGKRPDVQGVKPTVVFEGSTPKIGINGLTSEHLGKLDIGEVSSETAKRTTQWLRKATTLMVWAPSTSAALSYQADVLDAILDGFETSGWTRLADLEIVARECEEGE